MSTALDIEVVGAGEREREIRAAARAAAKAACVDDGHLAVSIVGEPEIARLNREHRGRDAPTDVLSFPVDGAEPAAGPRELGDVVVCPERCDDVAEAVVHGVLHLCGHDHEADQGEMLELQDRVMGEVREEAAAVDPDGARIARRMERALNGVAIFGNGFGAVTVFAFIAFLAPVSVPQDEYDRLLVRSAIAFVPFMGLTLLIGRRWAYRRFTDPVREWLRSGRPPTDADRRRVVRQPLEFAVSAGLFWVLAAVVFTLINLDSSAGAQSIGLTILLGAFTSCSLQYLLVERALRPVAERAMAGAPPPTVAVPGVATRVLMSWLLATGVPLFALVGYAISDLSGGNDALAAIVFLGFVALVLGLLAILVAARSVADPVGSVRRALERVEQGDLTTRVPVDDASEIGMLQAGFNRMAAGLEERERLRDLFGRHVGEEVAQAALGSGAALGGEVRDVAALFVDLVGSTTMASERPPEEVVSLLNDFFRIVVEVTADHGGFVNKFEGDAALCVFGAPVEHEDYAGDALRAARELRERLARELPHIDVGIGLAAGPAVAGNIGSEQRFEYTVIGDPVNEAARLCELAKTRPERVLASAAALERAAEGEARQWELGEQVQLRGRRAATRLASPRVAERA